MIEKDIFLEKFRSLFDSTDPAEIMLSTHFKDLEEWSSLTILSLIVMCEEEFNAKILPESIEKAETVEDLCNYASAK